MFTRIASFDNIDPVEECLAPKSGFTRRLIDVKVAGSESIKLGHFEVEIVGGNKNLTQPLRHVLEKIQHRERRHAGHHAKVDYGLVSTVLKQLKQLIREEKISPDNSIILANAINETIVHAVEKQSNGTVAVMLRGHVNYFIVGVGGFEGLEKLVQLVLDLSLFDGDVESSQKVRLMNAEKVINFCFRAVFMSHPQRGCVAI